MGTVLLLRSERVLFLSAVLVMFGHIALAALPGLTGVTVGLVLIAVGSGGVKANATSPVGTLYTEHDERRDAGFSPFYLGIDVGALAGPLLFLPLAGGGPNTAPLPALIGILLVFTIAESLLSPVGLSLSTKLAPGSFHTQMVALFFLSVALSTRCPAPWPGSTAPTARPRTSGYSAPWRSCSAWPWPAGPSRT